MSESRRQHEGSGEERGAEAVRAELTETRQELAAAREQIAEAREGIAEAREGIEEVVDSALAFAASRQLASGGETGPAAIDEIIENELAALGDRLSPYQQTIMADLLRLHFSLRGPQHLLESSGNFNRPIYPPIRSRR